MGAGQGNIIQFIKDKSMNDWAKILSDFLNQSKKGDLKTSQKAKLDYKDFTGASLRN